jgi:hypothetical protein
MSHVSTFYLYHVHYFISILTMAKTVYDLFGNSIVLSNDFAQIINVPNSTLCIDASQVITYPAMMFETTDGSFEKYYLRTIEWDNLVLIAVKKTGENFITTHYVLNPPNERIPQLIKECTQIK